MAEPKLTEEERQELMEWNRKFADDALRTTPSTAEERAQMRTLIPGIYAAMNNLKPVPKPHNIVYAPSALSGRYAMAFALVIKEAIEDDGYTLTDQMIKDALAVAPELQVIQIMQALLAPEPGEHPVDFFATGDVITNNPHVDWHKSFLWPMEQMRAMDKALKLNGVGMKCANECWRIAQSGIQWSAWNAQYAYMKEKKGIEFQDGIWRPWYEASRISTTRLIGNGCTIITEFPSTFTFDDRDRPHNPDGPFFGWADGSGFFCVNGVVAPAFVVKHPERITMDDINAQENAEIRRLMIDRYGVERWLEDANGKLIDSSADPGQIEWPEWWLENEDENRVREHLANHEEKHLFLYEVRSDAFADGVMYAMRVRNGTPDTPGGDDYKYYWVIPRQDKRTALEAAWTMYRGEKSLLSYSKKRRH